MPRAITYAEYGDPDVLTLVDEPLAEPGPGQVRVRVAATGVNPFDTKLRRGLFAGGKPMATPKRVGRDLAGTVDAVGSGVDGLSVGDRVVGNVNGGTSAEYVVVKADGLLPVPEGMDLVIAAAIPGAGSAAVRALGLARVQPGQVVLIHAASGGVGSFATQLAAAAGITVIGTASAGSQDYLAELGAIPVVYGDGWEDRVRAAVPAGAGIDAVVDLAGTGVIEGSLALVTAGGPVVTLNDFSAKGPGVIVSSGGEPGFENALRDAVDAVADGRVTVRIDRTFPLEHFADAHRLSESGHVRGKIVVAVAADPEQS
ncbi:zinc-binding dehydrogenase [Nakamurella sp. YIM 132087]|uniref:Zinc-binding dehydrogenase n=1 Tax=Nakamurella alba TaxID=2665158 RepID=A0A7K1FNQ1_9ACTN|nr:NADP-dependent oxidoreductase [Nakamurella alba]MTD15795.1 zinc-binding dehydrogenase [Nakamurella alba]